MKIPHWPIYTGPNKDYLQTVPRMKRILQLISEPHKRLRNVIHITGTKGKGSTALYITHILRACGHTVNTYTSPHIYECNERILLDGQQVNDNDLLYAIETVRLACETTTDANTLDIQNPSMFEALTCAAFLLMAQNNADFNVIEVGMGARHDATNVFDENPPLACVFTPIHIDHVRFLGSDVLQVAWNKSFLIKPQTTAVIISSQSTEVAQLLHKIAKQNNVPNTYTYNIDYYVTFDGANTPIYHNTKLDTCFAFQHPNMPGEYQYINASCAITTCLFLQTHHFTQLLTPTAINQGIQNTFNIARMQAITAGPLYRALPPHSLFYMDGAHNQLSAHALAGWILNFIKQTSSMRQPYFVCLAVARTKGADNTVFLSEFLTNNHPLIDLLIATRANLESIPEPPEKIATTGQQLGFQTATAYDIQQVIYHANSLNKNKCPILLICTGSLYLARDITAVNNG